MANERRQSAKSVTKQARLETKCPCGKESPIESLYLNEEQQLLARCICEECRAVYWVTFDLSELVAVFPRTTFTTQDLNSLTALRIRDED